jgi:hypothetical protein
MEVRHVLQVQIDATILCTSKSLYALGINILYGKNTFSFNMLDTAWRESPPTLFPRDQLHLPHPGKPNPFNWAVEINNAIPLIERCVRPENLPGYAYYDHFLRFLHFIGSKNAARIKTLEFSGTVNRHRCSEK